MSEWLKTLKPGDLVIVDMSSHFNRRNYIKDTVEKITPTGRIKLTTSGQYYPDGREVGNKYGHAKLLPPTPEHLEIIKRRELRYKVRFEKIIDKLSSDKLELILKWQEELIGNKEDN